VNSEESLIEQAWRILRRRKWIILEATIVVPLIAVLLTLNHTAEYTSTATLLFRSSPAGPTESATIVDPTREAATNGELVGLPVIAEEAAKKLPGVSAAEILGSVEVAPSPNAETAAVTATTGSPELSAELANAYGEAYIDFRRQADRGQLQEAISLAESSLGELTVEQREGAQGEALNKQLEQLKLTQALQTGGAELVQKATPASEPVASHRTRNVALGLILGVLLGFGLAILLERIDRRVRSVEELEEIYGLPVIGRIPRSRRLSGIRQSIDTQTPEADSFRVLRANLRYFGGTSGSRAMLVVSPEAGDGKSTVARGLATTMAEMGDDVVLVEADLRRGGSGAKKTARATLGLSNVLAGMRKLDEVVETVDVTAAGSDQRRELTVVPSGPPPPNPSELLEDGRMEQVLADLARDFSITIIDSPALGAVSDALSLFPVVSEIVVIGGLGKTTRDSAMKLHEQFSLAEKQPIGLIVNFADNERAKYSQYYRAEPPARSPSTR
jgi:capsular exopolysaccharide synthesis family protein